MIDFLCRKKVKANILDMTHGLGRFTAKLTNPKYAVVCAIDIRKELQPDVNADFNMLPIASQSINVVCYDPPYLSSSTKAGVHYKRKGIMWDNFATEQQQGHALAIREAHRILAKDGFFIWKDKVCRYSIPFFKFWDLFIQNDGKTPPMHSTKAIKNYEMYAVYTK
jgi:hypothetical protein